MRKLLSVIIFFTYLQVDGQDIQKWQLVTSFQPELTFHSNNYSRIRSSQPLDTITRASFSYGAGAALKFNVSQRLFLQAGFNLVFRNMRKTLIFFNKREMPIKDTTGPLITTSSISLRTLELPVNVGYSILNSKRGKISLLAGYAFNYLLNVRYNDEWTFKRNYWQGHSILLGAEYSKPINDNINFLAAAMYSIRNTVSTDTYIMSQDEPFIDLPHKFLKMNLGLELKL